MKRRRVLLVSDDGEGSRKIEWALREWDILRVCKLDEGLGSLENGTFHAVVVDLCPEEEERAAFSLKGFLEDRKRKTAVIVLSRGGGRREELASIESGADDWIAKPSTPEIIAARVRSRVHWRSEVRSLSAGEFSLDPDSYVGKQGTREICFTETETKVLEVLLEHPGRIVSKRQLIARVYGAGYPGTDHGLQSAIKRIRQKIERDPKAPDCLLNVHGQGYRFEPPKPPEPIRGAARQSRFVARPSPELVAIR